MTLRLALVLASVLTAPAANAQSLLRQEPLPRPAEGEAEPDPQAALRGLSLTFVEAPKPREFQVHDLVTIIVQEQSRQESKAKLDTKKDAEISGRINSLPDLMDLLELRLDSTDASPLVTVGASGDSEFKGDGKYERSERMTDRITAEVIDVKPNGTLVLEARRTIRKDDQLQTLVLSGNCRRDDVTNANTVLSSQLAELTIGVESEGDVRDTAKKGWLTRVFETVFNF
jgi:flagellar L-ring protein FlgH